MGFLLATRDVLLLLGIVAGRSGSIVVHSFVVVVVTLIAFGILSAGRLRVCGDETRRVL